jgi:mannose-1-phosphate guanylyltransferase
MNESLYKETPNVNLFQVGGKNNTIIGESKRIISLVDVDDIIIVDTPDVLMISRK